MRGVGSKAEGDERHVKDTLRCALVCTQPSAFLTRAHTRCIMTWFE